MNIVDPQNFVDGAVLLFDKPYGWTSFDVVNKVKSIKKNLKPESLLEVAQKLANHPSMTSTKRQPKTSLAQLMRKILNSDNRVSEDDL